MLSFSLLVLVVSLSNMYSLLDWCSQRKWIGPLISLQTAFKRIGQTNLHAEEVLFSHSVYTFNLHMDYLLGYVVVLWQPLCFDDNERNILCQGILDRIHAEETPVAANVKLQIASQGNWNILTHTYLIRFWSSSEPLWKVARDITHTNNSYSYLVQAVPFHVL